MEFEVGEFKGEILIVARYDCDGECDCLALYGDSLIKLWMAAKRLMVCSAFSSKKASG